MILVVYFAPVFGFFNLLYHWNFEQIQFAVRKNRDISPDDVLQLYNRTHILWSTLDRWDYTDPSNPTPPSYTLYTGYSIGEYFSYFWIILAFHTYCNILVKCIFSKQFREEANNLEILTHAFENCNFPIYWKDWDEGVGTVQDHQERLKMVRQEVLAIMFVHFIISSVMLSPMIYTGNSIH